MRILAVADMESRALWDHFEKNRLEGVDLILSAGDLNGQYLSFLETMTNVPVLYVHGNHDTSYDIVPPEGCICVDGRLYVHEGVRILGLGGSMNYNNGPHQYTQEQMRRRARRLAPSLLLRGGFDILLTHAPAAGVHDGTDLTHQGFQVFNTLIGRYHPDLHIHGHMHKSYGPGFCREDSNQGTRVINAWESYIFCYEK